MYNFILMSLFLKKGMEGKKSKIKIKIRIKNFIKTFANYNILKKGYSMKFRTGF